MTFFLQMSYRPKGNNIRVTIASLTLEFLFKNIITLSTYTRDHYITILSRLLLARRLKLQHFSDATEASSQRPSAGFVYITYNIYTHSHTLMFAQSHPMAGSVV